MKKITRTLILLSLAIICLSQCKKDADKICAGNTIKVISVDTALSLNFSNSRRSIVLSNENNYQVVQITTTKGYVDAGNGRKGAIINLPMEKGSMNTIYLVLDTVFLGESTTVNIAACNQPIQFIFPVISSRCDSLKKMNTIESSIQQKMLGTDSSEIIADGISKTYIELRSTKLDEEVTLTTSAGLIEVDNKTGQTITTVLKAGNVTRIFINSSTIPDNKVNLIMNRCFENKVLYTLKYKQPIATPNKSDSALTLRGDSILVADTLQHSFNAEIKNLNIQPATNGSLIHFTVGEANVDSLYRKINLLTPYVYFSYSNALKSGVSACTIENKTLLKGVFWLKAEWVGKEAIRDSLLVRFK